LKARRPGLSFLVPVCLILGLGLMIPFEETITRLLGMALLSAFIIGGLFLIVESGFLTQDRE
jgi:hypothetical protein